MIRWLRPNRVAKLLLLVLGIPLAVVALAVGVVVATRATKTTSMPLRHSIPSPTISDWVESTAIPTPSVGGYLAVSQNEVIFLQWNQNGDTLNGTAFVTWIVGDPPHESTTNQTLAIYGTLTSAQISLSFGGDPPQFGSLTSSGFILSVPASDGTLTTLSFTRASVSDYNTAVQQLAARATDANAQASYSQAIQQQEAIIERNAQDVVSALKQLQTDIAELQDAVARQTDDVTSTSQQLADTVTAKQKVISDLNQGSSDAQMTACSDADEAVTAADEVQSSAENLEGDAETVTYYVNSIQENITTLDNAVSALRDSESSVPGYVPSNAPATDDVDRAITQARSAIKTAVETTNSNLAKVNQIVAEAYANAAAAYQAADCGSPPTAPSPYPLLTAPASADQQK